MDRPCECPLDRQLDRRSDSGDGKFHFVPEHLRLPSAVISKIRGVALCVIRPLSIALRHGIILMAKPMFVNLGIGGGVSLLAGLACLGVFGMFYLWRYGAWLRSKSTFAKS
jgi:hypothetical protein